MNFLKKLPKIILLLGFTLSFTSCEGTLDDIFGEWDRPTPAQSDPSVNPYATPFTLEAIENGTIEIFFAGGYIPPKPITYTKNGSNSIVVNEANNTISVNAGDIICFFSENSSLGYDSDRYVNFHPSNKCFIYGNIMSLINDEGDFSTDKTISGDYAFCSFLYLGNKLYSHQKKPFLLPATTLSESCYRDMFDGCINLTITPDLPATNLAKKCYSMMFSCCKGLTRAPELPATVLAENCYSSMFYYCENITNAPVLHAQTLVDGCYSAMFEHCLKISSVICKATSGFDSTDPFLYWLVGAGTESETTPTIYVPASQSAVWSTAPMNTSFVIPSPWQLSPTL